MRCGRRKQVVGILKPFSSLLFESVISLCLCLLRSLCSNSFSNVEDAFITGEAFTGGRCRSPISRSGIDRQAFEQLERDPDCPLGMKGNSYLERINLLMYFHTLLQQSKGRPTNLGFRAALAKVRPSVSSHELGTSVDETEHQQKLFGMLS